MRKLERVNEEQLNVQANAIKAHIRRTKKDHGDTKDAEMELCYVEREKEVRENRKRAHEMYLKELQENARQLQEEEEAIREFYEHGNG